MQVTVTLQNEVKSSSPTSHEPSRLVILFRNGHYLAPGWGWGGGIWLFHDNTYPLSPPPPHPKALYHSYDSLPPSPWRLIGDQFSEVPLLYSVGEN